MSQSALKQTFRRILRWLKSLLQSRSEIRGLESIGAILGLLLLLLIFSFLSAPFRQTGNLTFIAKSTAITVGIVAVGQTVVLISGGIDLSVSSVIAITGIITASLMKYGFGPVPPLEGHWCYLAIAVGWLIGSLIGALQGWLITRYQMPAFIVTLGTMVGLRGLSVAISNSASINVPDDFKWVFDGHIGIIPSPVLIMLVVYLFTAYMLKHTKMGRYCYAIGGNETAARLAGIAVDRYRVYFYAYSGLLAALTGTILISYINTAIYTNGDGLQFTSVAATIIGGTSLTGGVGGIWGTLIGALIMAIIPNGMILLNAPFGWRDVVIGAVILIAIFIDVNRQRVRKSTIRMEALQTIPSGHYLYELLGKLSQLIEKYTGTSLCRVYLTDRDTGDLVSQELFSPDKNGSNPPMLLGKSRIVTEAKESGSVILIQDLARTGYQRVMPMRHEVQSALALPLLNRERCIGVIELQSPGLAIFKESTIETLKTITGPLVVNLEDAWLFESGWLVRQVRDALRHLWDDLYLGRMALADWALSEQDLRPDRSTGARGEALRNLLVETIEDLKPQELHDPTRGARIYRIMQMTYAQEQAVDQILRVLHISRRQYFYDLKDSIEILSDMLVRNHCGSLTEGHNRPPVRVIV